MDVREKLVELLNGVQHYGTICTMSQTDDRCASIKQVSNTEVAERLIANGVTVQELDGCEHCNNGKTIETDIDGKIEIVKMIPLPAIDLMTGEHESKAAPPYWAMRLLLDGGEDFVQIHCCPMCGRRLPQPPKGE